MSYQNPSRRRASRLSTSVRLGVAAVAACFLSTPVLSLPVNPTVVNGAAGFNQTGNVLTVTNSNGAIINWQKFSIQTGETTHFAQTSASSTVLNRVLSDPTAIYGTLSSNGRVWLVNPAGIMVGPGGKVDVARFVASTLNISNADFLAGRNVFINDGSAGNVINQGEIRTPAGGSVYLIGSNVTNEGIITTPKGETILAAGATVSLIDSATPGVKVDITGTEGNATNLGTITAEAGRIGIAGVIVRNSGTINASSVVSEGGRVFLKASQDAYVDGNGRIVTTGTKGGSVEVLGNRVAIMGNAEIDASGTGDTNAGGGKILVGGDYQGKNPDIQNANVSYFGPNATLKADAGKVGDGGTVIVWADDTTRAYGSISARGGVNGGNGGFVETSGHRYLDVAGIKVLAGTWLLDPYDLTVTSVTDATISAGSPYIFTSGSGGSNVCNIDIQTQLNLGTSVVLQTGGTLGDLNGNGDITVSSAITKTGVVASDLTLKAHRSIVINAPITSVNSAMSVNLDAHFSDDSPTASGNVSIFADITTNGGNLWVGGGSTLGGTGYAIGYDTASANPYQRYGILLNNGVSISTGGGSVTMRGRGVDNATGGDADGIDMWSGSSINAGGGTIVLAGVGGNNPNVDTSGVYIAGTVQTSGTGTITIAGTGGSNSLIGANRGVHINGGTVQGQDGLVSITGTGGDGTGAYNVGILIDSGSTIQTTGTAGTGNLALIGTGGSGVNSTYENYGVLLDSSTLRSVAGSISVTGYGGGGGGTNSGIAILNQSTIEATGSGSITLEGTGGTGSGWNSGIDAWNGPNLIRTASGSISVTGYGGTAATGESNMGVWLEAYGDSFGSGTTVESTKGGNVTIWGQGGSGTLNNHGVYIQGASQVRTNGGDLSITGYGGAASGYRNVGVLVEGVYDWDRNGNNVLLRPLIEATGSGNLSITGTGGTGTFNNRGVELVGASVRVRDGALSISGTGGPGSQDSNQGVALSSNSEQEVPTPEIDYSVVESIGKGAIQITGTAVADAAGSDNNNGVAIQQYSLVRSAGGAITIAGTAAGTNNIGPTDNPAVLISGSVIANSAHDSGLVTVTGKTTSGVSYGVDIDSTGAIVSTNRDVTLQSASADGGVYVAGSVQAENLTVSGPLTLERVDIDPVLHARGLAKFDDVTGINGSNVSVVAGSIEAGNIRTLPWFFNSWAPTGAISLTANAGSITTGNLRSSLSNPASEFDTSGAITLKALDNVSTGDIATYIYSYTNSYTENSVTANAGAVSVVAQRGAINTGYIDTGYIDTSSITSYTTAGRGGDVHMNAGTGISVGGILTSSEAGSGTAFIASASGGGNVILYANGGDVTTGAIDTGARVFGGNIGSSAGNAGGIILRASDNVLVAGNIATDSTNSGSGSTGYGGEVSLYALGGTLTVTDAINASSSNWYGGNVTLFSIGGTSVNNAVVTAARVPDGLVGLISSDGQTPGQITIIGNGDTYDSGDTGLAPNGDYIVKTGGISLGAASIFARNIILSAAYDISTSGMVIADAGGWVSMRAASGSITIGNTVSAPGGDILLRAMGSDADGQILGTGNLFAQGSGSSFPNGGTIRLVADRDINYSGNISASADSEGGGSGGSILIRSLLGSINLGSATPLAAISANGYGNGGNGGNIEISLGGGAGDITLGTATYALSISANGDGGYNPADGSDGGKGGNVRINALASSSGNITHYGDISVVGGWGSDSNNWQLAGGKGGDGGTVIIEAGAGGSATLGSMIDASGANGGQGDFTGSGAIPYDTRGGDGGKGGSISVTAPGAVSVEYLYTNGGDSGGGRSNGNGGNGGIIELTSTTGGVTVVSNIKALGGTYYCCDGWGGDGGKGGTVKLKAYVGEVNVGSYIDVSGGYGYRAGNALNYNYSEPTRGGNGGAGGTVLIEAQTNIALNDWVYANGGSGGFGFRVTDGVLLVYTTPGGDGGKGGTVSLTSYGGTVAAGGIDAYGRSGGAGRIGGNGGDGGSVALNGDGGVTVRSFALPGEIDASGGSTYGSDNSQGGNGGKGGSVEIKSTTGGVTVYGSIYITGGYGATGGNNYPDSTVLPIAAGHGGDGGTLTIEAQTDISLPDWVYVNGGSGGNGLWDDNLGAYVSPGGNGGKGGDVSITSYGGTVAVGGIDAWGRSGGGGRIGGNGGDGGSVSLRATGSAADIAMIGNIDVSGGWRGDGTNGAPHGLGGDGGTVTAQSVGNISLATIYGDGGEGGGSGSTVLIESTTGSISVDRTHANASADWGTPPPDVASGPGTDGGHGGNITLRVTQPVLASFIDAGWISANGADGGSTLDIAAPAGAGGAGGIVRLEFGTSAAPGSIGGAVSLYQADLGAGWSGCDSVACSVTQASPGSVTAIAYGGNLTVGRSSDRTDLTTSAATFIGVTSSDALSLQAPKGMVLSGSGSNGLFSGTPAYFIDASAQSIKVSAGSGIGTAGAPLKVDSSALNFSNAASDVFIGSDYTLSVDAGLSSSGGNISLTGVGVTNSGSITGTGGVAIDAGTGMLSNAAGSIISTEGSISLIADAMTLAGGTITAPGNDYLNINNPGSVFLTTSLISAPRDITLGGTGSGLNLSSADLQTITATNGLVIGGNPECTSSPGFCVGRNSSGNLTVSGPTDLTGVGGVWGLALMTSGSIAVNSPLSTTEGVSLDGVSVTNSSSITGTHVALTADTMSLSAGTISAGVSGVDLRTYTMGKSISLGAAGTNTLDISSADLQSISSTGGLRIGDSWNTPGGVTVTGPITLIDLAGLTGGSLVLQSATNSIEVNAALASPVPVELSSDGMGTISEGSGGSISAPSLVTRSVNSTTLNGANAVDSFAAPQFVPNGQSVLTDNGVVSLTNTTPTLTLGQVNVGSLAVHNTGAIAISPAGYVNASGAGDAIVLDASTGFTNNATLAASALTTSGGGRWLIYAPDPVSVTKNGLTLASYQYNTSYGGTVAPTGNSFVYVSPLFVDANFSGTLSSTFGANPTATPGYALRGLDVDDTATAAAITGSATYSNWPITGSSAATSYTLQYVSGLTPALPYALTPGTSQTYTVNPAILAYTINASLQGTAQKIYDGNTDATLTPGNFLLAGFVNGDMADVTKTAGTYLTRNVGSGIQISTSLAGSDFNWTAGNASNYILPTIAVGNIGVITQLGSVTWTGGATGNWSLASNWAGGALPDAQNVANVVIPGGKVVTFDSGVVPTTLTSISSLGGLVINSGSLAVNSSLATQTYQQTGGSLTGTGGFTVTDSFAQTGGSIALTGAAPVSITQTAGDARVGSLSNAGGAVTITANNAILDENGAALNITANSVNLTSAYGGTAGGLAISLDTAASNQLTATVSSGNGGIYLRNFTASAPATINLTDSGSSNPGIAFYQDSNLSLGGASFYGGTGNIVVGAGGSMSGIQSSRFGGTPANIILIADSGMSMSGALASSGNIGLSAATLDIGAALSGANVTLNGSTTLNVSAATAATGDLLAGAGVMSINATGSMTAGNNMALGATTIDVNGLVMAGNNIELAATTINVNGGLVRADNNVALVTPLVGGTINLAYGGGVSAGANGTPSSINGIPYQGIAFVAQNVTADGGFLNAGGLTGDISGLVSGNVTLKNGAYFSAGNDIELVLAGSDSTVSLSGSHFLADYATGVAATIYLDFLTRTSGGVMIDGTATTTTLPGGSGFFTVDQSTPATESAKSLVITYANTTTVDPCVSSPDICKPPLPIDNPVVDDVAGDPCATAPDSAQCKAIKLGEKEKDEKDSFGDGEHDENSSQKKVGTCGV